MHARKHFLSRNPFDKKLKITFDNWDIIKLKVVSTVKETTKKKRNSQIGRESLPGIYLTE